MTTSHKVRIQGSSVEFPCNDSESVLAAMRRSGHDAIRVGCQGGGCGACRIQVIDGSYSKRRMSRAHVSESQEADGYALACRISPTSTLLIRLES